MGTFIDLSGKRYGRLQVIKRAQDLIATRSGRVFPIVTWMCVCDCGNEITVQSVNLRHGRTRSCGCLQRETAEHYCREIGQRASHGDSMPGRNRLYNVWASMKSRCSNPKNPVYKHYGGRGITVCDAWKEYLNFKTWAMENGYNPDAIRGECTIDRIDVNKGYSPDNCRWVNMSTQNKNKTNTKVR